MALDANEELDDDDGPPSKYEIYGDDAEKSQEFSEGDAFLV